MNYLETGLPHTEFFPKKTNFRPPRYMPLCSLGRKYLGLEPLTRDELKGIITRLCQPKRQKTERELTPDLSPRDDGLDLKPARRFVGRKRMSSFEIEKMVDRLYSRRKTKDFEFVENTFETQDFINMTDRDSEDEAEDEVFTLKTDAEKRITRLQRDRSFVLKDKSNNSNINMYKQKTHYGDIGDSVKINGTHDKVRTVTGANRKELINDQLKIISRPTNSISNIKNECDPTRQTGQRHNFSCHIDGDHTVNKAVKRNVTSTDENATRRVPRLIKTADSWSRRTETVTRQVNRIRRPVSNPANDTQPTTPQTGVLNLKLTRSSSRPEYTTTRHVNNLPSLQLTDKLQNIHPNNYQPPTEENCIDQVASSNSPRH